MKLDIYVLRPWIYLIRFSQFNGGLAVRKDLYGTHTPKSNALDQLNQPHGFLSCRTCCGVLGFTCRQCDGRLQLRTPTNWASSQLEDVAGGGPPSVNTASVVCINVPLHFL